MNSTVINLTTTPGAIANNKSEGCRTAESRVSETNIFNKRIGSTHYKVNVFFNASSKETLKEKALRLMINDLSFDSKRATMQPLQADWLPERSSL